MRMIILAAGQGTRLRPLTDDRPKCMVELAGRPLIAWTIEAARNAGIKDITVIGGYRVDQLRSLGVDLIENPAFETTNMVRTLFCARERFDDGFVMSYGDIVYHPDVLRRLLAEPAPIGVVVDRGWRAYWEERSDDPLADAETLALNSDGAITDIGQKASSLEAIEAQYIGLASFRGTGVAALVDAYRDAEEAQTCGRNPFDGPRSLDRLYMTDLLQGLIGRGKTLQSVPIDRGWVEVDNPRDLEVAERIARSGMLGGLA